MAIPQIGDACPGRAAAPYRDLHGLRRLVVAAQPNTLPPVTWAGWAERPGHAPAADLDLRQQCCRQNQAWDVSPNVGTKVEPNHSWICCTIGSHQVPAKSSTTTDCEGAAKLPAIMTSRQIRGLF